MLLWVVNIDFLFDSRSLECVKSSLRRRAPSASVGPGFAAVTAVYCNTYTVVNLARNFFLLFSVRNFAEIKLGSKRSFL